MRKFIDHRELVAVISIADAVRGKTWTEDWLSHGLQLRRISDTIFYHEDATKVQKIFQDVRNTITPETTKSVPVRKIVMRHLGINFQNMWYQEMDEILRPWQTLEELEPLLKLEERYLGHGELTKKIRKNPINFLKESYSGVLALVRLSDLYTPHATKNRLKKYILNSVSHIERVLKDIQVPAHYGECISLDNDLGNSDVDLLRLEADLKNKFPRHHYLLALKNIREMGPAFDHWENIAEVFLALPNLEKISDSMLLRLLEELDKPISSKEREILLKITERFYPMRLKEIVEKSRAGKLLNSTEQSCLKILFKMGGGGQ